MSPTSPSRHLPSHSSCARAVLLSLALWPLLWGGQPVAASAAVPAVAKAPAEAASGDKLEHLRERLAQRLGTVKSSPGGGGTLQVVSVTPAAGLVPPLPSSPGPGRARAAAPAGGSTPPATNPREKAVAHGGLHWSYSGEVGPQAWGGLRAEFSMCAKGQRQSPIDIREGIAVDLEPIQFNYQAGAFGVIDNGHTVQVNVAPGNWIDLGGRRFDLVQFHFHRPSEERIDGRQFDMSVHLVHKDAAGRLAVVGVLLGKGATLQPVIQTVWNNLPLEKNQEARARSALDPAQLLPADRRYYTYMGSLTTPPCSEGVQWVVMRQPVTAGPEQIEIFSRLYPMNARPVQGGSGRRIMQSN